MKKPKRIILKISGEAFGASHENAKKIAETVHRATEFGIEIGIVVGGGNIFRGNQAHDFGFDKAPADYVGMLATVINGLIFAQALSQLGTRVRVMSSMAIAGITERYHWQHARDYLANGEIVIFVGGTGSPYFTTDTTGALRASEMGADLLLKATKVDGVYDADPVKHKDAKKFNTISFDDALTRDLKVMDGTAIALCRDNNIPIYVFDLFAEGGLEQAILELAGGTLIGGNHDS